MDLKTFFMSKDKRLENGLCPDCAGKLIVGPWGGSGRDCVCEKCHKEFVICPDIGNLLVQRLGKCSPERLKSVYGIG